MANAATGTDLYHSVPQAARIQKRLALNQCFRTMREACGRSDSLTYVTFGGEEMHDVMDFLAVFDVKDHRLSIVSYEEDSAVATKSSTCPVATTLSQIETVSITVVSSPFFDQPSPLHQARDLGRFIYFLDDTKPFGALQAEKVEELLRSALLRDADFLLITSCITPRIMHQASFLQDHLEEFHSYFGNDAVVDRDFKVRNHVDMHLGRVFSAHDKFADISDGQLLRLRPVLLRKLRYRDTRAAMGLWLYKIQRATKRSVTIADVDFERFPISFSYKPEQEEGIPDLFADM